MNKLFSFFFAFLIIMLLFTPAVSQWENLRDYETITIQGNKLSSFNSVPISEFFFFRFDMTTGSWQEITAQIDELDGSWDYFITPNGILDANDEISFLARDVGDRAQKYQWIPDENSASFTRIELEFDDPLQPENTRYIYVYRSQTLQHDPNLPNYLHYIPGHDGYSDSLSAAGYYIGHSKYGIIDRWRILPENGGQNIDILDRMKARVKGKVAGISLNKSEQDLKVDSYKKKVGPVRMIREVKYKISTFGLNITVGTFRFKYYPFHIVGLGSNKTLTSEYNISLIRQSFDLNLNGIGMIFNNPNNIDVPVDGSSDAVDKTIFPLPETNWYMCSGEPGTFVLINEFTELVNANYRLYYHDNSAGGTDDGTSDTGVDNKSYADAGILFTGSKIEGQFSLPFTTYFLPANQDREVGLQVVENYRNPLEIQSVAQSYAEPVVATISIPDTSAGYFMPVAVPIQVENLQNEQLSKVQMTVLFDSLKLRFDSLSTENSMTASWDTISVSQSPDSIFLYLANSFPANADSGTLCRLNFTPVGDVGDTAVIACDSVKLNQGYPFVRKVNGSITILPPPQVLVSLADTTAYTNSTFLLPVRVSDLTSLLVRNCHFEISFDKFALGATSVTLENSLTAGANLDYSISSAQVSIDIFSPEPVDSSGVLFWVEFEVTGASGSYSDIVFTAAQFNDGVPLTVTQNGRVSIIEFPPLDVFFSIPDTVVAPQTLLKIPVSVSDITAAQVTSFRVNLSFDESVIDYISLQKDSSIIQGWNPSVYDLGAGLVIVGGGSPSLQGSGVFCYLNFQVTGSQGDQTELVFDAVQLGGQNTNINAQNGTIAVQSAVPVELASFTAKVFDEKVLLKWLTLSESDNYGFYLQRKSSDEMWREIGFVSAAEKSTAANSYSFIDGCPPIGEIFYRLKQQDLDGSFNFSNEINVLISAPKAISLEQNYPNPFNSSTIIKYELSGKFKGAVSLKIFNTLGQPIRNLIKANQATPGRYQIRWDGKNDFGHEVSSGVYYLRLTAGKATFYRKLLFLR